MAHIHPVTIYYEDTDFTGLVYHANYLKYMERAREELLGMDEQKRLWNEDNLAFAVYQCTLRFKAAAHHAETLEVRTEVSAPTPYRAVFEQNVWRPGTERPLVEGTVELVCIDRAGTLQKMPAHILERLKERTG